MKLNIYDHKKIVKTYEAETYDLMFGTLEDVAAVVKVDELKSGSDVEIIKLAVQAVLGSMDTVKELMHDIFDGITDEELRHTTISEMAVVLADVVKYTIKKLGELKIKNV